MADKEWFKNLVKNVEHFFATATQEEIDDSIVATGWFKYEIQPDGTKKMVGNEERIREFEEGQRELEQFLKQEAYEHGEEENEFYENS